MNLLNLLLFSWIFRRRSRHGSRRTWRRLTTLRAFHFLLAIRQLWLSVICACNYRRRTSGVDGEMATLVVLAFLYQISQCTGVMAANERSVNSALLVSEKLAVAFKRSARQLVWSCRAQKLVYSRYPLK